MFRTFKTLDGASLQIAGEMHCYQRNVASLNRPGHHKLVIRSCNISWRSTNKIRNEEVISVICRPGKEGKEFGVTLEGSAFVKKMKDALAEVQSGLYAEALAFRDSNVRDVSTYPELKLAISEGYWARGPWAGTFFPRSQDCEKLPSLLKGFALLWLLQWQRCHIGYHLESSCQSHNI